MASENVVSVIIRAVDEMSADLKRLEGELGKLSNAGGKTNNTLDDMSQQSKETSKALESLNTVFTTLGAVNVQFAGQMRGVLGLVQALQKGLPIVALGALAAVTLKVAKDFSEAANQLARFNKLTGISVETLSALKLSADLNDSSIQEFASGLRFFQRNLSSASRGVGESVNTFKDLGFSLNDLKEFTKNPEIALERVAKSFQNLGTDAEKTEAAMRFFGRGGQAQIQILEDIANKGMKGLREEAKKLGVLMTDELAKAGKEFNDNMTVLGKSLEGFAAVVAGPVVTALNAMIAKYREWLSLEDKTPTEDLRKSVRRRIDTISETLADRLKRQSKPGEVTPTAEELKDSSARAIGELANKYPKERNLVEGLGRAYYEMAEVVGKDAVPAVSALNDGSKKLHLTNTALKEGIESLAKSLNEQVQSLETEIVKFKDGEDAALRLALQLKVAAFAEDLYKKTGETISTAPFDAQIETIVSLTAKVRNLAAAEQARQALHDKSRSFDLDETKALFGDVAGFEAEMFRILENVLDADAYDALYAKIDGLVEKFKAAKESAEYLAKIEAKDVERQKEDVQQDPNEARAKRLQFLNEQERQQNFVFDKANIFQQSQLSLLQDQLGVLQAQNAPYMAIIEAARQIDELEKGILRTEIAKKEVALETSKIKLEGKDISPAEFDVAEAELTALKARLDVIGTKVRDMTNDIAQRGKDAAEALASSFADTFISLLETGAGGESFATRLKAFFSNLGRTLMAQGLTEALKLALEGPVTEQMKNSPDSKAPSSIAGLIFGSLKNVFSGGLTNKKEAGATPGEVSMPEQVGGPPPDEALGPAVSGVSAEFEKLALLSKGLGDGFTVVAQGVTGFFSSILGFVDALTGGGGSKGLGIAKGVLGIFGSIFGMFSGGAPDYSGGTGSSGSGQVFGPGAAGGGLEFAAHGGIFTHYGMGNQPNPYKFARGGMVTRGPVMGVIGEEGDEIVARMLPAGAGGKGRGGNSGTGDTTLNVVLVDSRSKVPTAADIVMVIANDMQSNGKVAKASTKLATKR